MLVEEITDQMHPSICKDELATRARALIRDLHLRILPVVDTNKKLLGKISRRNIMAVSSSLSLIRVEGIMTMPKYVAALTDDAPTTIRKMLKAGAWFAPVTSSATDETYRGVLGLEGFIRVTLMRNPEKFSQDVSEVMTTDVVACSPEAEVDNVWRLMQEESLAGLPVVEKGKLVGIVSQKDLLDNGALKPTFEAKKGRFRTSRKICAIMSTNIASVRPSTKLDDAAKIMISKNVGRVPVTDEKTKLVGIVDREDIVRAILKWGS